jgi:hypothetical protein
MSIYNAADIRRLLMKNLDSNIEDVSKHAETLDGPRTRGSTTKRGLGSLPNDRPAERVYPAAVNPELQCYKLWAPELCGRIGAISLREALDSGNSVKVRNGLHGNELYMTAVGELPMTDNIYVIIGDFMGEQVIYTWHPGEPLGAYEDPLSDMTGVKIE